MDGQTGLMTLIGSVAPRSRQERCDSAEFWRHLLLHLNTALYARSTDRLPATVPFYHCESLQPSPKPFRYASRSTKAQGPELEHPLATYGYMCGP